MQEDWRPYQHEGSKKRYLISNLGKVKSWDKDGKVHIHSTYKNNGYRCIPYTKSDGKHGLIYLHKVLLNVWVGNPNTYHHYKFLDGNPSNCKADNLKWISKEEARTIRSNRVKSLGLTHSRYPSNAKMSLARVAILKKRILENEKTKRTKWTIMAKQFGIDYRHLYLIRKEKLWKRVKPAK